MPNFFVVVGTTAIVVVDFSGIFPRFHRGRWPLVRTTMKILATIFTITVLVISGCKEQKDNFQLIESFENATRIYCEGDVDLAATALVNFIALVEKNTDRAEKVEGVQYKKLLDMSWLRLASVYQTQGKETQYAQAMDRATYYFDQDPHTASDEAYKRDKHAYLLDVLQQVELTRMPEWKRPIKKGQVA